MARWNEHNWLDKAISETVPDRPARPDFQVWRRRHAGALETLRRRARQVSGSSRDAASPAEWATGVIRSPLAKLAIAAAFVAVTLLLTWYAVDRQSVSSVPDANLAGAHRATQAVLARASQLSEEGDTDGLMALLESTQVETRTLIVEHLGQTGDRAVLPVLEQLAVQSQGTPVASKVHLAIDQIRRRQALVRGTSDIDSTSGGSGRAPGVVPTHVIVGHGQIKGTSISDPIVYRGQVADEAGQPVRGVRVWGMAFSTTLRRRDFAQETLTDSDGRFELAAQRPNPTAEASRVLRFDHPDYAMAWRNLKTGETVPSEDIKVTLRASTEFRGIVVDTSGRPIATAMVEVVLKLADDEDVGRLRLWKLTGSATYVDDAGRFTLERLPVDAWLDLRISAERYAAHSPGYKLSRDGTTEAGQKPVTITLNPGRCITGRIVYDDGQPYGDRALIRIDVSDAVNLIFATDDAGRFTSPGLAPGDCYVRAFRSEDRLLSPQVHVAVDLDNGAPEVELKIPQASQFIEVQTVDETTGAPLADVLVSADSVDIEGVSAVARTDENGACTLRVLQGRCRITAQGWKDGHFEPVGTTLTVGSEPTPRIRIRMTARSQVVGRLIGPDGSPLEGVVQLRGQPPIETHPDGWFAIDEPLGDPLKYHVLWAHDATRQMGQMIVFRMADYTDALVVTLAPCATIIGHPVDAHGNAVNLVRCRLGIVTPDGTVFCYGQVPWMLDVGARGDFIFTNVPAGWPLRVNVEEEGWQGEMQGDVEVPPLPAGRTVDIGEVVVRPIDHFNEDIDWTGTLTGTITDEKGEPVARRPVRAYTGIDSFETSTDSEGRYALTRLPRGVKLNFTVSLGDDRYCYRYIYADSNNGDMQVCLHGYELLGGEAPSLSVTTWFDHEPIALDELRGQVVLLQVGMLLPSAPTRLDSVERKSSRFSLYGLESIAVHHSPDVSWTGRITEAGIRSRLRQTRHSFVFCLDDAHQTWTAYRTDVSPTLYLIDRQGYVRMSPSPQEVEQAVEILLTE